MAWQKSPPALISLFDAALPAAPDVERRKMFGYPCAFVNGQMFSGLHENRVAIRLPVADHAAARLALGGDPFEPMPGRIMREYVAVPGDPLPDRSVLAHWVARAHAYAGSLSPKRPSRPKRRA
jgi:TfoX/Sxy family transcriptional regulator of competence genes